VRNPFPAGRLRSLGIVGMNRRNAEYVLPHNPRRLYQLVDDKLQTKKLAERAGIAVPELYGVIEAHRQVRELDRIIEKYDDFVIKPAHGSGGNGILVINHRSERGYRASSGRLISVDEIEYHISNILSGLYSLGGIPDKAIIEYRVRFDPVFAGLSFQGVPDIRTIVFRGVPIAAMVRLPTHESDGKANLHQGAVGVGIDLVTGGTDGGVHHNRPIDYHPDTGASLSGIPIPGWEKLVALAAHCYDLAQLGYLGVDIVLDQNLGPLVLELNARPGLSIQLACRRGLHDMLRQIENLENIPELASERAALAVDLFERTRCG
jgi:alpha-L-glutamate ligase-like protein